MSRGPAPPGPWARWRSRLRHGLRGRWAWLVWLAVAAGALWLYGDLGGLTRAPGISEIREIPLGSLQPARVSSIEVLPGQAVHEGEGLATLDTALIDAEIEVVRAEIQRLNDEIEGQKLRLTADLLTQVSRLSAAAERSTLDLVQVQTRKARTRAEIEALDTEIGRQDTLVSSRLAAVDSLQALRRRRATLAEDLEGASRAIRLLEHQSRDSLSRLSRWRLLASENDQGGASSSSLKGTGAGEEPETEPSLSAWLRPLQGAVNVQEKRLEQLEGKRAGYLLRAPTAGHVASVLLRPGSVTRPGTPVLTFVSSGSNLIIAYVNEPQALLVRPGQRVRAVARDRSAPAWGGMVISLGPSISEMPIRFRPSFTRPSWCREALIRLDPFTDPRSRLLPGQAFDVTFLKEWSALVAAPRHCPTSKEVWRAPGSGGDSASSTQARTQRSKVPLPPAPAPLDLPAGLAARTRFEPSGLLWVDELGRFLIVSDDTGTPDEQDHAPWVFTMSRDGVVDELPLVLEGVKEVNDLEALARGPAGIYLLSSQNASRRGRRPASREQLLLARLGPGRRLVVTARVALLAAIVDAARHSADPGWLEGLGLGARISPMTRVGPDGTDLLLNIEGMAFREGALLLGLKEPLSPRGEALLWRLDRPDHLIESGSLDPADLRLHANLDLKVMHQGETLALGISGLEPGPAGGGSLLLLATLPRPAKSPVGALWQVLLTAAGPPRLSRKLLFPALKPEGLAVVPGGPLTLVFDQGDQPALWLQTPL